MMGLYECEYGAADSRSRSRRPNGESRGEGPRSRTVCSRLCRGRGRSRCRGNGIGGRRGADSFWVQGDCHRKRGTVCVCVTFLLCARGARGKGALHVSRNLQPQRKHHRDHGYGKRLFMSCFSCLMPDHSLASCAYWQGRELELSRCMGRSSRASTQPMYYHTPLYALYDLICPETSVLWPFQPPASPHPLHDTYTLKRDHLSSTRYRTT